VIHVAVGILQNSKGELLIAKRPPDKYKPGLWEFPGGKVEKDETVFSALKREFKEEIGIEIITAEPWLQFSHDYGDRIVLLDTWRIMQFAGEAFGAEGQEICWVLPAHLKQFEFPEGNQFILKNL
jgi:8-oxo-dGTP diphosphatase